MKCDCLRPADRFSSAFRFSVFSFRPRIFWFSAREVLRNHSSASAGHWTSAVNLGRRNSGLAPEFLVVWVVVRFFQLHTGRQPRILAELTAKLTIYRSFRFNLQFTQFAYTTLAFSRHCSSRHAQALSQSPCEHPEDPRAASRNPPPPTDRCFAHSGACHHRCGQPNPPGAVPASPRACLEVLPSGIRPEDKFVHDWAAFPIALAATGATTPFSFRTHNNFARTENPLTIIYFTVYLIPSRPRRLPSKNNLGTAVSAFQDLIATAPITICKIRRYKEKRKEATPCRLWTQHQKKKEGE